MKEFDPNVETIVDYLTKEGINMDNVILKVFLKYLMSIIRVPIRWISMASGSPAGFSGIIWVA